MLIYLISNVIISKLSIKYILFHFFKIPYQNPRSWIFAKHHHCLLLAKGKRTRQMNQSDQLLQRMACLV